MNIFIVYRGLQNTKFTSFNRMCCGTPATGEVNNVVHETSKTQMDRSYVEPLWVYNMLCRYIKQLQIYIGQWEASAIYTIDASQVKIEEQIIKHIA